MAFYSKNITPAECNYQIYDKELLAIIRYLKHWRPELECTDISVKIFTDHQELMYFAEGQDLSRRQARYLDMLSEFNIKIIYRPGPQNTKADTLTRMAGAVSIDPDDKRLRQQHRTILTPDRWQLHESSEDIELDEIDIYDIDDPIFHRIAETNKTNEYCSDIRTAITEGKEKYQGITLSKCSVQDNALYYMDRL